MEAKTERIHCARLLKHRDSLLYEVIEKIVDLGQNHDGLLFQVQWKALPDKRDYT